jgi:hypothetical protein
MAAPIVAVKPQTVGDVGAGYKADHAAGDEAYRASHDSAGARAKCAVDHPLSGACGGRRHQRHGNECDRNGLSHDSLHAVVCLQGASRSPPPFIHLVKHPPAGLKLRKRILEPIEIDSREALRRRYGGRN